MQSSHNIHVTLNSVQGRKSEYLCDAETSSARRLGYTLATDKYLGLRISTKKAAVDDSGFLLIILSPIRDVRALFLQHRNCRLSLICRTESFLDYQKASSPLLQESQIRSSFLQKLLPQVICNLDLLPTLSA